MSEDIRTLFEEGQSHFASDAARAIAAYEQVVSEHSEHYMAHFNLAMLYARRGLIELGLTHLDAAMKSAHGDILREEMAEVFWGAWSRGTGEGDTGDGTTTGQSLSANGFFTAGALDQAAQSATESPEKGAYFCPQCNTTIEDPAVDSCPGCGASRPQPPFNWYHDALLGRTIIGGRYTLVRKIDWGGHGVVYEAVAEKVDGRPRRVIKLVESGSIADIPGLQADLEALQKGADDALVRMYAFKNLARAGKFCTVMELLDGQSVGDRVGRGGVLEPAEAVRIAHRVAVALVFAHERGVFHGSLKPTNVFLVGDEQRVKVLNIGRTDKLDPFAPLRILPIGNRTAPYSAPEQFEDQRTRTAAVDIYQLGVLLFAMLTGRRPYEIGPAEGPDAVHSAQQAAAQGGAPHPSQHRSMLALMPELDRLVASLIATNPADRPADMAEVVELLGNLPVVGPTLDVSDRGADAGHARVTMSVIDEAASARHRAEAEAFEEKARASLDVKERAAALLEAGRVYRQRLKAPERAAQVLEEALDADHTQMAAFKELTLLHAEAEHWEGLRDAYERMIARLESADSPHWEMIGLLQSKLGEVLRQHLRDRRGAIEAYERAVEHHPGVVMFRTALAELYADTAGGDTVALGKAVAHLRPIVMADPSDPDLVRRLGVLHLRARQFDEALCAFRVLSYLGGCDQRAQAFVDAHDSTVFELPQVAIPSDAYYRNFTDDHFDAPLAEVFAFLTPALLPLFELELEDWDLRRRDAIKDDKLMFVRIYRAAARLLHYPETPVLYRKRDIDGMQNGNLDPTGFLVGGWPLAATSEEEVGALVVKKLALFLTPSHLVQTRSISDLEALFYNLAKQVEPSINLVENEGTRKVRAALVKYEDSHPQAWKHLQTVVRGLLDRREQINIGQLVDAFDDASNRLAMLITDDVQTISGMIRRESFPLRPERSYRDRMAVVLRWMLDPRHHKLRRELGLAIGGGDA